MQLIGKYEQKRGKIKSLVHIHECIVHAHAVFPKYLVANFGEQNFLFLKKNKNVNKMIDSFPVSYHTFPPSHNNFK